MNCQVDKNSSNSSSKAKDERALQCCASTFNPLRGPPVPTRVTMREKKGSGALSRVQKLKKRLSHSFGRLW
ncbi:hypothetical protein R5R35_013814 [Gryllus longicercus]|uniref:Uncharacterized protein n=1 Tax=Gryllus longicercus TaxID=2509291 RepID=A0AAN9Z130_9ORTH